MPKPEFVRENEIHKIRRDFRIQRDRLNPAKRPVLGIINNNKKESLSYSQLCRSICPQSENEGKRKERQVRRRG